MGRLSAACRALACAGLLGATALTTPAGAVTATRLGAPYEAGGVWFVPASDPGYDEKGLAAEYGAGMEGRRTASGERFDPNALAAAHATLPLPGVVEVTNLDTGKTLRLTINDRGPYAEGRILSLTPAAARALGVPHGRSAHVRVRYPEAENRSVAATAPGAAESGFTVQVGAFSDRARAERVALEASSTGASHITPLERGGQTLFRVTVGPMVDDEAAALVRRRLGMLGYDEARVTAAP